MHKTLAQALPELVAAGILDPATADRIRAFYGAEQGSTQAPQASRLILVFGLLGALLTGLGLMLLVAHNWDNMPRPAQVALGFLPLMAGCVVTGWAILRRQGQAAWQEGAATFTFLAIGGCMALISQIYHTGGSLSDFLLAWAVLGAPLILLLRASLVSILYIGGITWYVSEVGYFDGSPRTVPWAYWPLLGVALVHYYGLYRHAPGSNFLRLHHLAVAISLAVALGTLSQQDPDLLLLAYLFLFSAYILAGGSLRLGEETASRNNGYTVVGFAGMVVLLLTLSFRFYWDALADGTFQLSQGLATPMLWVALALFAVCALLFVRMPRADWSEVLHQPWEMAFAAVAVIFLLGLSSPILATVLINLLVLAIGVQAVRQGVARDSLRQLNLGLAFISLLVLCRFFDMEMTFLLRGLLFIALGVTFFLANYRMLNRRRA